MTPTLRKSITIVLGITLLQGCVQQKMKKEVTFTVDMRQAPPFEQVGIRGNLPPLSWEAAIPLADTDGDSLFSVSLELETGQSILFFKFEADGSYELCGKPNRELRFRYEPEILEYHAQFDQAASK